MRRFVESKGAGTKNITNRLDSNVLGKLLWPKVP